MGSPILDKIHDLDSPILDQIRELKESTERQDVDLVPKTILERVQNAADLDQVCGAGFFGENVAGWVRGDGGSSSQGHSISPPS